jgi:hypothetical protein
MTFPPGSPLPSTNSSDASPELEATLTAIENCLSGLGDALRTRDSVAIESHASSLHRALATAVDRFTNAARAGEVPAAMRKRLAQASGQVAAQRESLARATAALDRAIDVLLPREAGSPKLYGANGGSDRGPRSGYLQA